MARLPRLILPGHAHHLIQRGHNRQAIFLTDEDRRAYLGFLRDAARAAHVDIHAYVLMPNHVHLLATPASEAALGRMMQSLGRRYVGWFNQRHGRTGTLWEGRYRGAPLEAASYLLACMRYIELNPVRAGVVSAPQDYPWSSYAHHVGAGRRDPLVSEHAQYWQMGNTPFEREVAYRHWVAQGVGEAEAARLTDAALKGWALGGEGYLSQVAATTSRPLVARAKGRPRKGGGASS